MTVETTQGLLDSNVVILRSRIEASQLPDLMAISAVTLAELSAGSHALRPNDRQSHYDEHEERAPRLDVLQRA
jgi:predicted nucleic acid-binding protein